MTFPAAPQESGGAELERLLEEAEAVMREGACNAQVATAVAVVL